MVGGGVGVVRELYWLSFEIATLSVGECAWIMGSIVNDTRTENILWPMFSILS